MVGGNLGGRSTRRTIGFRSERQFNVVNYLILTAYLLITLFPLLNVLAKSMSTESGILTGKVVVWPVGFTLDAYRYTLQSPVFWRATLNQVLVTVAGSVWGMTLTVLMAYPITRKRFMGKAFWAVFLVIPMYFNPGIIPHYLVMRSLGLTNTLWALIIPMFGGMNVLILKSYLEGIDAAMEESARIDGASNLRTLASIMVPLCQPVIATLTLFYAVGQWTSYLGPSIYLTRRELQTLQLYLRNLLAEIESNTAVIGATADWQLMLAKSPQAVRAATIVIAALPMVLLYPFVQRYFIHGLTIGSVKG